MAENEADVYVNAADDGSAVVPRPDGAAQMSPPRWKRRLRRVVIGFGVFVGVLVATALLLYYFGGMEPPRPEFRSAYAQLVSQGSAAQVGNRFVIPIPGCRCHSTDAAQQVQHSVYRIRECSSCH